MNQHKECATGLVWHERMMWHDTGSGASELPSGGWLEPGEHSENPATKRRLKNLLDATGLTERLLVLPPRPATVDELLRVHTEAYVDRIRELSMGRGGDKDFMASERASATAFARMAREEGVERVVYLGGLGDRPQSKHLRSRHETAMALAEHGPPLTYFRAGMVVGAQSESYRTLRFLVQRLPAMIAPAWLKNATQPIAIEDTLRYLAQAPSVPASTGREIQIGGPDILSYGEMLDRMALALGLRPRMRRRRRRAPTF